MNRRRELILQRVSRIGEITALGGMSQTAKFRGKPVGTLTIEAAIGTYMRRVQDSYISTLNEPSQQEKQQLSRQMSEYMAAIEETRIITSGANYECDDLNDKLNIAKFKEVLEKDHSAQYQLNRYIKKKQKHVQSAYDILDANRSSGFLLYSYNKSGAHSILGEHTPAGSYGGYIVEGDFQSKA